MKHRFRKVEGVYQRHAAQIYTEMLGQVCHKGLYNSDIDGFEEVLTYHQALYDSVLIAVICISRKTCYILLLLR